MRTLATATLTKIAQKVTLEGWVDARRSHGKIVFLDLRDRSGIVQLVLQKNQVDIGLEDVIKVSGTVKQRPSTMINPKITTGTIEVEVDSIVVTSKAAEIPLPIGGDGYDISEDVRLKYRYLDLRRPRLQSIVRMRSAFVDKVRQYLFGNEFVEIETPMLTKSTPEGSRDFLVPSRMQPGSFYALPQSPQQYKQLLMVAGFERYFQIARCLRDEDLRADRGFEHTQVDIEMSFVEQKDVMQLIEKLTIEVIESLGGKILKKPFPIFTYDEAMKKYGADKFDMRSQSQKEQGLHAFAWVIDFPFFEKDKEGNWTFTHNPFSDVHPSQKEAFLKGQIEGIKTTQYDLVWNGFEAGGGSIRSTNPHVLRRVFEILGHTQEKIDREFGHILKAFEYGVPPHGGIALGIDRWTMCLAGEHSIREVQAFPMTSGGQTSVMNAPSEVSKIQLQELGLQLVGDSNATIFDRIVAGLSKQRCSFEVYTHKKVLTSEEAAAIRGTPLKQGAKALLLYGDKKPLMVALPGNQKLDMSVFKKLNGIKDLRMATPEEVTQVTSVTIGAVPPFGHLFKIPLFIEKKLLDNEYVVFNAGEHTRSIQVKVDDYKNFAQGTIGSFSK